MVQRDPADIEEQRRLENSLEDAAIALEVAVLAIIARRLGKLENVPLVEVYASMPADIAEMQKAIREGSKGLQQTVRNAIDAMASANDGWAADFYAAKGIEQIPASEHFAMKEAIRRNAKAVTDTIKAMCDSSVIAIIREDARGKKVQYTPLEEGYKQIVSEAASSMANGSKTVEQAVSQAVRNLSQNGLKVRYAPRYDAQGSKVYTTRNLHSAVRMNVMDAYRTCMGELREIQGREFGADGVEVSAHALSAPDHVEYQGIQYSYEPKRGYKLWDDVKRETAARPLETGANCGHMLSYILLDVSEPKYTKAELRDLKNRSQESVTFKGLSGDELTMSRYEASQYQRRLETTIRDAKKDAYLNEQAKQASKAKEARAKARAYTSQYKRISKEVGLIARDDLLRLHVQK